MALALIYEPKHGIRLVGVVTVNILFGLLYKLPFEGSI